MSNRAYKPSQIFAAVQAVEQGLLATTVSERMGCSVGSVLRWHRVFRGASLKDIKHGTEASIKAERFRRDAARYQAERRAWRVIMHALEVPLSCRIQLFGKLQSAKLVSVNQAKSMLCVASPRTASVKFERDATVILRVMKKHLSENLSHGLILMFHQVLKGKICGYIRAKRVYAEAGLQLYRRNGKRLPHGEKRHLTISPHINATWSMDFMHFRLVNGAPARTLNVLDDFSRECLLMKGGFGTSAALVADQLAELVAKRGAPETIRCDNGPEFTGHALLQWAAKAGISIRHIDPFRSYQNGYVERFNRTVRNDLFQWKRFASISEFERAAEEFRYLYNHVRPHKSLGWVSPAAYAAGDPH